MLRYALRDDQWMKIKDFLPGREGHVGGTAPDNRLFVDAVIYRYRRRCESGVFARVFEILARDADSEYVSLDSTSVRAHQHSADAQKTKALTKRLGVHAAD